MKAKVEAWMRVLFAGFCAFYAHVMTTIVLHQHRWIFWAVVTCGVLLVLAALGLYVKNEEAA